MQTTGMTDTFLPKIISGVALGASSLATADWSMAIFGVPVSVLLAAAGGSVIALSTMAEMIPRQVIAVVLIGFLIGIYGSQLLVYWQQWERSTLAPVAFFAALLGHAGMMLVFKQGRDLALAWARRSLGLPPSDGGSAP